jgi:hypothetical protein
VVHGELFEYVEYIRTVGLQTLAMHMHCHEGFKGGNKIDCPMGILQDSHRSTREGRVFGKAVEWDWQQRRR